jgi:hypothetical protein
MPTAAKTTGPLVACLVLLAMAGVARAGSGLRPPRGMIPFYDEIDLKDGRTLFLGCENCTSNEAHHASSIVGEIYDPKTRSFSRSGKMIAARCAAKVVLLPNQEVLFVGGGICEGTDFHSLEKVVEIFDPANARFREVGELHTPRFELSATLLHNGQVLIAEGVNAHQHLVRESEIYDSREHRLKLVGDMVFPRCWAARVVLTDGAVLFAGGFECNWPPDAGSEGYDVLKTAERYDPATARFRRAGDMKEARVSAGAILLRDGRALIVGGRPAYNRGTWADGEIYDSRTSAFSLTGKMTVPRCGPNVRLMKNGWVLVSGGGYAGPPGMSFSQRSTEAYDPATNTFLSQSQ